MKKRFLGFLLALCMLFSMIPVSASALETDGTNESTVAQSARSAATSFYDLYVTDGLVAFYDAFDPQSDVLDLKNGKWYAKVYNGANGTFEKTANSAYTATIVGDWTKEKKGFSYYTNESVSNKISFPVSLISSLENYSAEFVGRVDLREVHDAPQESGTVTKTTANGKTTYIISNLTLLVRNGSSYYTNRAYYTVTLKGEANENVDLVINGKAVSITLDGNGDYVYMAACEANLDTYTIVAPSSVALSFSKDTKLNSECISYAAFVFGTLYCTNWTNKLGDNMWGNGKGTARWYIASADWSVHNGSFANSAYGGAYKDGGMFRDYNGKISVMTVDKTELAAGESYAITLGHFSGILNGNRKFADQKLDLLSDTCGAALAFRLYNRHLTAEEKALNAFVDKMLYNDVDFAAYGKLTEEEKEAFQNTVADLDIAAGEAAYADALASILGGEVQGNESRAMSDYDKLYVGADGSKTENSGGLIALYSAYKGDTDSVNLANHVWRNKVTKNDAIIAGALYEEATGNGYWRMREDGGFGYDLSVKYTSGLSTTSRYNNASGVNITLDPSLISSSDFAVEYVVKYEYLDLDNGSGVVGKYTGTTATNDISNRNPATVIGLFKDYAVRGGNYDSIHRGTRWYITDGVAGWGSGDLTYNSATWGDASRATDDVIVQTVSRDETAEEDGSYSAVYTVYKDGVASVLGEYSSNETRGAYKYHHGVTGSFQLFRQMPVSVFAIRVYDAELTVAEMAHNRFIDLAAYCGADLTAYIDLADEERTLVDAAFAEIPFITDVNMFAWWLDNAIANAIERCKTVSGECGAEGSTLKWKLRLETGELEITGNGAMVDRASIPWDFYRSYIRFVKIGNGVTRIGSYAFYDCEHLVSVEFPSSVTSIGSSAFDNTGYYKDPSNWENDVLYIENWLIKAKSAFDGNYTVKFGTVGIADSAFAECDTLKKIAIPESVVSIGTFAFYQCRNLESAAISEGVVAIGDGAFFDCTSLESIAIPSSVTSIGSSAFEDCDSLTSITIPSSVTSIGPYAFYNCVNLNAVYISSPIIAAALTGSDSSVCGNLEDLSCRFAFAIRADVTNLASYVQEYYAHVNIITYLGEVYVVYSNHSHKEASVWESFTDGGYEGEKCSVCGLLQDIPDNDHIELWDISEIGNGSLIAKLYAVDDGYELKIIGTGKMKDWSSYLLVPWNFYCSSIRSVTLGKGVTNIGERAFYHFTSVTHVEIPSSVVSIGASAFGDCTSLASVMIPSSVISIGASAFEDCTSLASIEIPSSVTSIGEYAFYGCVLLASIEIPSSVTSIGNGTFAGCLNLKSVKIPPSVTSIGDSAFSYCSNIETVYYPSSAKDYGNIAFFGTYSDPCAYGAMLICKIQIAFVDEDGTVLDEMTVDRGTVIVLPASPTKPETELVTYTFSGWEGYSEGMAAMDDIIFKAVYAVKYKGVLSLANTSFQTAWGLEFVTDITAAQISGVGGRFTFTVDESYAVLQKIESVSGVTYTVDGNAVTVTVSRAISENETLLTLTFKASEYLAVGETPFLHLLPSEGAQAAFTPIVIYEMGDANMDGKINSRDVVLIKQHVVKMVTLNEVQLAYANVYADETLNSRDAVLIQQFIVKMPVELGNRKDVTFVCETEEKGYTVPSGEDFAAVPEAPEGCVWSESATEYIAPSFAAIMTDVKYYLVKEEF